MTLAARGTYPTAPATDARFSFGRKVERDGRSGYDVTDNRARRSGMTFPGFVFEEAGLWWAMLPSSWARYGGEVLLDVAMPRRADAAAALAAHVEGTMLRAERRAKLRTDKGHRYLVEADGTVRFLWEGGLRTVAEMRAAGDSFGAGTFGPIVEAIQAPAPAPKPWAQQPPVACDYCNQPGTHADPLHQSWVAAPGGRGTVEEIAHGACSRQAARAQYR